ncbi:MAG: YdiY family protein [Congregibacter sp.]
MKFFKRWTPSSSLLLVASLLFAGGAHAVDRIELKDGSVILGTFQDADAGMVTIETAFAGVLVIDQTQIVAMNVVSELVLQMEDGQVLETPELTVAGEQLSLDSQSAQNYALADLMRINPEPWELGNGYRFTGLGSLAFNSQRGNTELDELDYRIEANWESLKDRYRIEGFGLVDESQGVKNAENWTIRGRYDRIQTGNWYWGAGALAQQDLFADLDLRTSFGPYLGRKFYTEPVFELEAEAGLAYVTEDFVTAEDREYVGATWSVNMQSNILGGDSRLYLNHNGIWNLDEAENVVLNTTFGVAFPLLGGIEGAAEIMWNINTGAVEGTEEVDEAYRLRLGYSW